jgi:hypothetical protein
MATAIGGMVVPVQRTAYLSGTECKVAIPGNARFPHCPQTANSAAVHGPVDDTGHGPMCADHARAQVAKCIRHACNQYR